MKNLLFKKVELWTLLLAGLLTLFGLVCALWVLKTEIDKPGKLGVLGEFSVILAEVPNLVKGSLNPNSPANPFGNAFLVADEPDRFGVQQGLKTEYELGSKPHYPFLLVHYMDTKRRLGISELIDLNTSSSEIIQEWDVEPLWKNTDLQSEHFNLVRDFPNYRFVPSVVSLSSDGSLRSVGYTPLIRGNVCSRLEIIQDDHIFHHTLEEDAEGNFWAPSLIEPATNKLGTHGLREDGIAKFNPSGEILFFKSIFDIIFENDLSNILYAVNHASIDRDPFHLNDIQPVLENGDYWQKGDIFLSLRNRSMLLLYRPSTNKVLWHKSAITSHQHDIDIISDHEITIFDNNMGSEQGFSVNGSNKVALYNFKEESLISLFADQIKENDVRTRYSGSAERFVDGGLMVEESNYGRILGLSITQNGGWSYVNRGNKEQKLMHHSGAKLINRDLAEAFLRSRSEAKCN